MTTGQQIPVAEGLFTWPSDEPRLIGAQCVRCGLVVFPAGTDTAACQRCGGTEVSEKLLSDRGTLWTFTTQNFRPPGPPYDGADTAETFQPYAVGYVELPGEVMIEARLTEPDPARLAIGQQMRLAIVPYSVRPDGTEILTFAFTPQAAAAREA
ncbi:MAG: OB-fold domain-containing protein [Streptosporangiaceae bacterium]|nr:OB-fold domain-containing protein [Streptosporangiaceae bacterium]MBV9855444.1 OB-fold domain-containing protein [Streptosporangiaceae bacterium]